MTSLTRHVSVILTGIVVTVSPVSRADEAKEHPLRPAIRYAQASVKKVADLPGYTAKFYKREVVGTSTVSHEMRIKIRHDPFSVYLYFEKPHKGREVLYVKGQNNGKLIAHEAGLFAIAGSMELAPTDALAMNENRYPITMAGIVNIVNEVIKTWEDEAKYQGTEVKYYKDAKLGEMNCRVIESVHPKPFRQFKNHKIRLWVDSETGYPVRVQTFGFPKRAGKKPPILEDYTFSNLKTDVRLTDADFDRNNKKYSF